MDVVAYDYTGYGISPNRSSEKNTYRDIEGVLGFIVNVLKHPLNKVILFGFSLGSGPTLEIASKYQTIAFVVLFAPFASCLTVVEGPNTYNEGSDKDMFNNLHKIEMLKCDLILVHGLEDKAIPSGHSDMLFEKFLETHTDTNYNVFLLESETAGHNGLLSELKDKNRELYNTMMEYFDRVLMSSELRRKAAESSEVDSIISVLNPIGKTRSKTWSKESFNRSRKSEPKGRNLEETEKLKEAFNAFEVDNTPLKRLMSRQDYLKKIKIEMKFI